MAPVGPCKAVGDVGLIERKLELDRRRSFGKVSWDWSVGTDVQKKSDAREVAVSTIGIDGSELALAWLAVTGRLMFMFVMAQMLRRLAIFVLTIAGHRCPRHLERQHCQQ